MLTLVKPNFSFVLNDKVISVHNLEGKTLVEEISDGYDSKVKTVHYYSKSKAPSHVLVGELNNGILTYKLINPSTCALRDVVGKHVVTREGLKTGSLNPIGRSLSYFSVGPSDCCYSDIILSLTAYFSNADDYELGLAMEFINIHNCAFKKRRGIKQAIKQLIDRYRCAIEHRHDRIRALIEQNFLPRYFLQIVNKLRCLETEHVLRSASISRASVVVGGEHDVFASGFGEFYNQELNIVEIPTAEAGISVERHRILIGGSTSLEELRHSPLMQRFIPKIGEYLQLIASAHVRQSATVAGQIVSASPTGDITNLLMALDASLTIRKRDKVRSLELRCFREGSTPVILDADEIISHVSIPKPSLKSYIDVQKMSKRRFLDTTSIMTAAHIVYEDGYIKYAAFSAGGLGRTANYLGSMQAYLIGKSLTVEHINEGIRLAQNDISPISDKRGSASYKRLLFQQLIYAHFISCFPKLFSVAKFIK